jgi:hypothetical protein
LIRGPISFPLVVCDFFKTPTMICSLLVIELYLHLRRPRILSLPHSFVGNLV